MSHQLLSGVVSDDPLRNLPVGSEVAIQPVVYGGTSEAIGTMPEGVTNWTFFAGALLFVVLKTGKTHEILGTTVMIAPGLAVTATHVFSDHVDAILAGSTAIACVGPTSSGLEIWRVLKFDVPEREDISYLSLSLASEVQPTWHFRTIGLTTRTPRQGELVSFVGFRVPKIRNLDNGLAASGSLYVSRGLVTAVYTKRDRLLMPYPTIQVACKTLGGMSGGAVFDAGGRLLGITSRGMETEDSEGPSNASWIIGALNRRIEIPWPPGLYPQPVRVMDIHDALLSIEGRGHYRVLDGQEYEFQVWFEPDEE